jgi:hypothetical protein
MEANHESSITMKGPHFNSENVKFEVGLRVDFGTKECSERMEKIKGMGFEPANNCIIISHEFESEDGPTKTIEKLEEMKNSGMLGPATPFLEGMKKEGKKLLGCIRLPPQMTEPLGLLEAVAASMGPEFTSKNQYFEFKISDSKALKEVIHDPSASILASALEGLCLQLTLAIQKDMPIKIADFICTMAPPQAHSQLKLVGQGFATFHHLKLEIVLREPTAEMKGAYKDEMTMGLASMGGMAMMMAEQFGVLEIAKMGGVKTTAALCFSPILSFEFNVLAPTILEALTKFTEGEQH